MADFIRISDKDFAIRESHKFIKDLAKKLDSEDYEPLDLSQVVTGLDLATYLIQGHSYPFLPLCIMPMLDNKPILAEAKIEAVSTDLDAYYLYVNINDIHRYGLNTLYNHITTMILSNKYRYEMLTHICGHLKDYCVDELNRLKIVTCNDVSSSIKSEILKFKLGILELSLINEFGNYNIYLHLNDNTYLLGTISFKDSELRGFSYLDSKLVMSTNLPELVIIILLLHFNAKEYQCDSIANELIDANVEIVSDYHNYSNLPTKFDSRLI